MHIYKLSNEQLEKVQEKVDYYCKTSIQESPENFKIRDLKKTKTPKAYYFDTYSMRDFFQKICQSILFLVMLLKFLNFPLL